MKKTVVSVGISRDNRNVVTLQIEDAHSGDNIIKVDFSLEEIGLLLTGLHGVKGVATYNELAHIAMNREVKKVSCDKVPYALSRKEDQINIVNKDFITTWEPLGWSLQNDGCSSQQNDNLHNYTIKRYVPVDDVLNVERFY